MANEYPKMLYRDDARDGTRHDLPGKGEESIHYAVANDADEAAEMLADGYRESVYAKDAVPVVEPLKPAKKAKAAPKAEG